MEILVEMQQAGRTVTAARYRCLSVIFFTAVAWP